MKERNEIRTGALLSYVNLLIGNLIPFFYTPLMLSILGQAEYGLYSLAQSIMSYIGLMNFGISGTIVRYISKYISLDDKEMEGRICGLFIKIYIFLSLGVLIVGLALSNNLEGFNQSLSSGEITRLKYLILILTLNTALSLPFNVFTSIIVAHQKFIFNKITAILLSVASPIINLIMLYNGFGSIGLAFSSLILNLMSFVCNVIYFKLFINVEISFKRVDGSLLKEILIYSLFVFIGSVIDILYWATDKVIIGWRLGTKETAIYNIGAMFNSYLTGLSTAISGLLVPKLTNMVFKNENLDKFSEIFIRIGRIQFLIVFFIISSFVIFGKTFILLWVGPLYSESYYIGLLTMIPVAIPLIQNTGLNILYAMNKHQFRSIVYFSIAVLNVFLTIWWVDKYGIVGAAAATALAYIVGNILIINLYYKFKIGLDIGFFWKNIFKMSIPLFALSFIAKGLVDLVDINRLNIFLIMAIIYTFSYLLVAYFLVMNDYEKGIFKGPLRKVKLLSKRSNLLFFNSK